MTIHLSVTLVDFDHTVQQNIEISPTVDVLTTFMPNPTRIIVSCYPGILTNVVFRTSATSNARLSQHLLSVLFSVQRKLICRCIFSSMCGQLV